MLDQIFGQMFASQWIAFVGLVILLVGLSELAWRMGIARSRKKPEADKDSGTVRSANAGSIRVVAWIQFRHRRRPERSAP